VRASSFALRGASPACPTPAVPFQCSPLLSISIFGSREGLCGRVPFLLIIISLQTCLLSIGSSSQNLDSSLLFFGGAWAPTQPVELYAEDRLSAHPPSKPLVPPGIFPRHSGSRPPQTLPPEYRRSTSRRLPIYLLLSIHFKVRFYTEFYSPPFSNVSLCRLV